LSSGSQPKASRVWVVKLSWRQLWRVTAAVAAAVVRVAERRPDTFCSVVKLAAVVARQLWHGMVGTVVRDDGQPFWVVK
jgi:hypothetical protein